MQNSTKYLYQKRLNGKLEKEDLKRIEDIYGNILESIQGALGN
jgi:hypothetical protein